jgi:hypothetical protein
LNESCSRGGIRGVPSNRHFDNRIGQILAKEVLFEMPNRQSGSLFRLVFTT